VLAEAGDQKYGNASGEVKADRLHFVVKMFFYVLGVLVRGHLDVRGKCLFWSHGGRGGECESKGERDWEAGGVRERKLGCYYCAE
jgi:hypothetical protein